MDGTAIKAMMAEIAPVIREYVADAHAPLVARIAELEARPAANAEPDNVVILRLVQDEIAKIPPAEPGKDADPEQVASLVAEQVERAVAAIPAPQDGKSVEIEDVAPLIEAEIAKAMTALPLPENGKDGEPGKDGRGVKDLLIDRNGELIATMDDGSTKNLGPIVGKDGAPGQPGKDGFNLEDFDVDKGDDGRTYILKFDGGEVRHEYELTFPVPVYCGIYKAGTEYVPGDLATWGGCLWHCDEKTNEKPDAGPWTMAVKKGRDGKDAK